MTIRAGPRLDRSLGQAALLAAGLLLATVAALPLRIPGFGQVAFDLGLAAVFFWSVRRPDLFPVAAAFALGLWQDVLSGGPAGLDALLLVAARAVVAARGEALRDRPFPFVWGCFALVALAAALARWLAASAFGLALIDPSPGLFQAALTAGAFPFVAWLLSRADGAPTAPHV